jgi:hypothetical protein
MRMAGQHCNLQTMILSRPADGELSSRKVAAAPWQALGNAPAGNARIIDL